MGSGQAPARRTRRAVKLNHPRGDTEAVDRRAVDPGRLLAIGTQDREVTIPQDEPQTNGAGSRRPCFGFGGLP